MTPKGLQELLPQALQFHLQQRSTRIGGGGEIAQLVASLSVTRSVQVRAWYNPLVSERWYAVTVLLNCSH